MVSSASKWIVFLLISSPILFSIAVVFKVYTIPVISEISAWHLPFLCRSVLGWLEPPYLYLVVNGIIIIIAASSKFQFHHQNRPVVLPPAVEPATAYPGGRAVVDVVFDDKCVVAEDGGRWATGGGGGDGDHGAGQKFKVSWKIPVTELTEIFPESLSRNMRPPGFTGFIHKSSASGSSKGGRALEKSGSRWQGSMEETWKAITGGPKMTRHLSRRDTWQDPQIILPRFRPPPPPPCSVKKSETFKDRELQPPPLIRREPSLSQNELNHRVEAFIERFNEEMRLQRQRSLDQLKEMMEQGL